jgi:phosphatidylglycerophosphatase A
LAGRFWPAAAAIATGFGIGTSPVAPGTWASLAALPLAWAIRAEWGAAGLAAAFALVFLLGCWAAGEVAAARGVRDPGSVVVDEIAGQWLTLVPLPVGSIVYALAFLLFRLFDIWKPWPIGWADRHVRGGFGIMLDDLLAAVYALAVLMAVRTIGEAVGVRL